MIARRKFFALTAGLLGISVTQTTYASNLAGSWEGRWGSTRTHHNGMLRGTFTEVGASAYQVNFRGRFFKIFPFHYSVVLNVVSNDGQTVRLQGSSYLGRMFGTFYYTATVRDGCFNAVYTSCKDDGYFRMTKCC